MQPFQQQHGDAFNASSPRFDHNPGTFKQYANGDVLQFSSKRTAEETGRTHLERMPALVAG